MAEEKEDGSGKSEGGGGYFRLVRRSSYNFIFAGILLLLYELSQLLLSSGPVQVSNAIDRLFKEVFAQIPNGTLYISGLLALVGLVYIIQDKRQGIQIRGSIFLFMFIESWLWAAVIFFNLSMLLSHMPLDNSLLMAGGVGQGPGYWTNLSLSLGA